MCILIDICTLPSVFEKDSVYHKEFEPVLKWILSGKGKIVYGGTKYKTELPKKYLSVFLEYKKVNKLVEVKDTEVDYFYTQLNKVKRAEKYDDPHLVAIIIASRCILVCTYDKGAMKFLRSREVYPKGVNRPKIYSKKSHSDLLHDKNIAKICNC